MKYTSFNIKNECKTQRGNLTLCSILTLKKSKQVCVSEKEWVSVCACVIVICLCSWTVIPWMTCCFECGSKNNSPVGWWNYTSSIPVWFSGPVFSSITYHTSLFAVFSLMEIVQNLLPPPPPPMPYKVHTQGNCVGKKNLSLCFALSSVSMHSASLVSGCTQHRISF